jgi:hypothetical protein
MTVSVDIRPDFKWFRGRAFDCKASAFDGWINFFDLESRASFRFGLAGAIFAFPLIGDILFWFEWGWFSHPSSNFAGSFET